MAPDLNSSLAENVAGRGGHIVCKPWRGGNANNDLFAKRDFKISAREGAITCPAGQARGV